MSLGSYGKIHNLGHAAVSGIQDHLLVVEEKVDGSQFSFGKIDGVLFARSKNVALDPDASYDGMFDRALEVVRELADKLTDGYTYRGEYLQKPKHNSLAYSRTPMNHIMIFDIDRGDQDYLDPMEKEIEAERIGLETVPLVMMGHVRSYDEFRELIDRESVLGSAKMEGVVLKAYGHYGKDGKTLMAKYVSEAFKETNRQNWKVAKHDDVKESIAQTCRTERRWEKAVERLRDEGQLTDTPRDIGELMKAVKADVREECEEDIKAALFKWAWPHIERRVAAGLPEWYKDRLAQKQFASSEDE